MPDDKQTAPALPCKRYDLVTNSRCGSSIEEMERSDDGEWVRYEELQAAFRELFIRADSYLSLLWHRHVPPDRKDIDLQINVERTIGDLRKASK